MTHPPGDAAARQRLDTVVARLRAAKEEETRLEAQLKAQRDIINACEETELPDIFAQLGIRKMQTTGGAKLELGLFASGTLTECPDEQKQAAAKWLAENDYEDTLKVVVTATFDKGNREAALAAAHYLRSTNVADVVVSEGAHWATIQKICRERVKDGSPVPLSLFNVSVANRVRYTAPKQRDY